MIHIWWECDPIQTFWKEIHSIIEQVTTYTLNYNPAQYLLLTIRERLLRTAKIEEMEELISIAQERIQKFTTTWACWTHFKTSDCYKAYFSR